MKKDNERYIVGERLKKRMREGGINRLKRGSIDERALENRERRQRVEEQKREG